MNDLESILNTIQRPFALEMKTEYQDKAVIGGLGAYVMNWVEKASENAASNQASLLRNLAELFRDYSEIERVIDQVVSQKFGMGFRQKLGDFFGMNEEQVGSLLSRFESDLSSGRFTFIVLMDHLHDQLKDLIAFINANSRFLLLGCEIEFYRYDEVDVLIPKLYRLGFRGALTIEREIRGPRQIRDIRGGRRFLEGIIRGLT